MKGILLCSMLLTSTGRLLSQDSSAMTRISPDFEYLMENSADDGTGKSATLDEMEMARSNPVNVNTATFQELRAVPFLPEAIAVKILCLRDSVGVLSASDLRRIPGLDGQTLSLFLPFVTFTFVKGKGHSPVFRDSLTALSFRSRGSVDIHPQKQDPDGEYSGSPIAEYDRLEIRTPRWSSGILFDKDAGESVKAGFVSGYLALENDGFIRNVVAGDFTINSGEGMMLSSARSSSKGGSVLYQIKSTGRTIGTFILRPTSITIFREGR